MKNKIIIILIFLGIFSFANLCSAGMLKADTKDKINIWSEAVGATGGYETSGNDIFGLIQTVINALLSIIGVLLLIYMLYAGYNWMTAQGEEEKVEKAKDTLKRAITGVIIIVAAYAISIFVMGRLQQGTLKNSSGSTPAVQNNPSVNPPNPPASNIDAGTPLPSEKDSFSS